MLDFSMEPMAMVLVWDMLDLDIPVLDMLDMVAMVVLVILVLATMARGQLMLSQRLMLVCTMEDMDMVLVLGMLDMVVMVLAMAVSAILVLVTMARGLLMLSQRLKLMLVFCMEPMDMVPVLDML